MCSQVESLDCGQPTLEEVVRRNGRDKASGQKDQLGSVIGLLWPP